MVLAFGVTFIFKADDSDVSMVFHFILIGFDDKNNIVMQV